MSELPAHYRNDQLAVHLHKRGVSMDDIDRIVERAAMLESAQKSRWKAGIDAQRMVLGDAVCIEHDI